MVLVIYDKQRIYEKSRSLLCRRFPHIITGGKGSCFYATATALVYLREAGLPVVLQAGSMSWPIIRREQDDGKRDTHFSYMWEIEDTIPDPVRPFLVTGHIPEVHCWLGIPETHELIDFSMPEMRKHARNELGEDAAGMVVPDYLWSNKLPDWVFYEPFRKATELAYVIVEKILEEMIS